MSTDTIITPPLNWDTPSSGAAPPVVPGGLSVTDPLVLTGTLLSIKQASVASNGFVTTSNQSFAGTKTFTSLVATNVTATDIFPAAIDMSNPAGTMLRITNIDNDPTLAANSDSNIPTQKAVKAYVASQSGGGSNASSLNMRAYVFNVGTMTYVPSPTMKWITIEACAGGGGTGYCVASQNTIITAAAGSGAYCRGIYFPSVFNTTSGTPMNQLFIQIGDGGTGAANGSVGGGTGGTTTINRMYQSTTDGSTQFEPLMILNGGMGSPSRADPGTLQAYQSATGMLGGTINAIVPGQAMLQLNGQIGATTFAIGNDFVYSGYGGITPLGMDTTLMTGYGQGAGGNYATSQNVPGQNGATGVCIINEYY